jgi:predicted ATPase
VHFEQGRDYRRAIQYLQRAVQNAKERSAHTEAITLLTKALELLKTFPDTPERAQQELTLQIALGRLQMATKGFASPERERAFTRARELCRQLGDTRQLFPMLHGLAAVHIVRGEFQLAHELIEQMLRIARSEQDQGLLVIAHHFLGQALYFQGEFVTARAHLEQGLAVYDFSQHHSLALLYGIDPGEHCLCFTAYTLWSLGYPDQALQSVHKALALAQQFSHPFNLAFIMNSIVAVHQMRREGPAALEWAGKTLALCREQGFALLIALEAVMQGWALAEQGQGEEGTTQIRQGVTAHQATGAVVGRPYYLLLLAEAYGKTGQAEEGLNALAEAVDFVEKTGERRHEAELYRLKGELTLQGANQKAKVKRQKSKIKTDPRPLTPDPQGEAEACFLKAIEIARQQQAKSLELRATVSLARLWQSQGKVREAHQMLAEVYGWFTEGFDTKDLQEAQTLLQELANH